MNMFDEARAIRALIDMRGITQREMAKNMGVSQGYIANKLRLLGFDKEVEEKITESALSERHARTLLRLADKRKQLSVIETIKERSLNVNETEALVDFIHAEDISCKLKTLSKTKAKDSFTIGITEIIRSLTAIGINIKEKRSYYKNKTYITICIEE